jgi:hypothetical protein
MNVLTSFLSRLITAAIVTAAGLTIATSQRSERALERGCITYSLSPAACLRL